MTTTLLKDEKIQIINSHNRNLYFSRYNLEIDKLQENAKNSPVAEVITKLNEQISEIDAQIDALNAELVIVNSLTE